MIKKIEPYKGIAEIYDEIRPSYPEKLIEDIISKTDLSLNNSILEIGAGTGKATVQFAKKGFAINAIELGEDMAAILKKKCTTYQKVSVDIASFAIFVYFKMKSDLALVYPSLLCLYLSISPNFSFPYSSATSLYSKR